MKLVLFSLMITFAAFSLTVNAQKKSKVRQKYIPVTKFDPARDASKDIKGAVAEAKRTNKKVYVDVGGEWCIWCHRLDDFYAANADLQNYLDKHYVFVKVNYSKENKNEDVLANYPKIEGYPHVFILDKKGKLIKSKNTGELEEGKGYNHDKVLEFLKEFAG
ncbi:MAG: thioredoxin family protein [Bacteroidetes bacterium]|nr:thioredoxin family protein [Bacteroidota bacterium]